MDIALLQKVTAFVWNEAALLDHSEHDAWLALWTGDGHYVVPIDPDAKDFEDSLNFAYDDEVMRRKRVERLRGGRSISTLPLPRILHQVSRIRILASGPGLVTVSTAQDICEFRKTTTRRHAADVTYDLETTGETYLIRNKVVRLLNSGDALTTVGFIF